LNLAKLPACLVLFSGIACTAPALTVDPALAADQALAADRGPAVAPSTTDWRFSFQEDARQIFSTRTLVILGVGGLLTAGAHAIEDPDQQARTFDQFEDIPDFGNTYGSSAVVVGGSAALALWGWTTERPTCAAAGVDMMRSYAYSTALVGALKIAFDRTRPDGGQYSFPSGHASAAFSIAPVITYHFGRVAGAAAYGCAVATLMGRMEDRRHYLSDVVFGATIGLAMGEAVIAQRRDVARHLKVDPDRVGLQIEF
jgi:membrane-associated phospholipid phosphatase